MLQCRRKPKLEGHWHFSADKKSVKGAILYWAHCHHCKWYTNSHHFSSVEKYMKDHIYMLHGFHA